MLAAVLSQAHRYPQLSAGHRTLRDAGEHLRPRCWLPMNSEGASSSGGGRNIGRAIALALAAAGAAVVINGRRNRQALDAVAAEITAMGGQALPVLADVADAAAVDGLLAAASQRFGRLGILINNTAVRPQ
jgi:3-oxoacyl-[acyl-carrier protein] reductase